MCWAGGGDYTFERCCDTSVSPRGDPSCFEGVFTFEVCCPNEEIVCQDDIYFSTTLGDCSTYLPGSPNDGYCDHDDAAAHCLVSCHMCEGGEDTDYWCAHCEPHRSISRLLCTIDRATAVPLPLIPLPLLPLPPTLPPPPLLLLLLLCCCCCCCWL